jgi:hypothetical protein
MKRNHAQKRNNLRKILKVQEDFLAEWEEGISKKFIWKKFIYNKYFIEYHTFINYLGVNARKELKELDEVITAERQNEEKMKGITPLFTIALALLIASCGVSKKDLAKACAEQYPCKDSLVVKETTKTDTLELWDTYVETDTIECPPSKEGVTLIDTDTVYLKGHKVVITRTVMDSTWYRTDQAALVAMQQDLDQADAAIAKLIIEKAVLAAKLKTNTTVGLIASAFVAIAIIALIAGLLRKKKKS